MAAELVFEANGLAKDYGGVPAVVDVSFTVGRGEILSLLGPNGAGKTTITNLFLGFTTATGGSAWVCGFEAGRQDIEVRRRLAYIPEQVSLYPYFTGLENLRYFVALASPERPSLPVLAGALAEAGLPEDAANRPVSTYSKGMRQKVGIALALAKQADALLLDEPTSGLDPGAAAEFSDLLRSLRDRGAGILMVTHDLFRAREVANRLGIIDRGRLVALLDARTTPPDELERRYLAATSRLPRSSEEQR